VFRLRSLLALLCGLALLGSACSSSDTKVLDLGKAEASIRRLAEQTYRAEAEIGAVKCPRSVALEKGSLFTCTVAIDGQPLVIGVRQKDAAGNVRINQLQAVVFTGKAERFVAEYATGVGRPTSSVSCGTKTVSARAPGELFTCTVHFVDGTTGVARLQVKNTDGRVGLQSLTPA
jgi:Domain of unknown function (DUF4333)